MTVLDLDHVVAAVEIAGGFEQDRDLLGAVQIAGFAEAYADQNERDYAGSSMRYEPAGYRHSKRA